MPVAILNISEKYKNLIGLNKILCNYLPVSEEGSIIEAIYVHLYC